MRVELGETLRDIREQQGWSQREMALQLGTTQAVLSYMENGKVDVKIDTLAKYANFLGYGMEIRFVEPKTEWDASFEDALTDIYGG